MEKTYTFAYSAYKRRSIAVTLGCVLLGLSIIVPLVLRFLEWEEDAIRVVSPLWIFDDFSNWFGILALVSNVVLLVYAWGYHHTKKAPTLFVISLFVLCADALSGIISAPGFGPVPLLIECTPYVFLGIVAAMSLVNVFKRTNKTEGIKILLAVSCFFAVLFAVSCFFTILNISPELWHVSVWANPAWSFYYFSYYLQRILLMISLQILLPNILKDFVLPKKTVRNINEHTTAGTDADITIKDEVYCSLGKHVVLLLFTFGVWQCIWVYRTTRFLNKAPCAIQQYHPTKKLLLYIFVPFYSIYWFYKHGQRLDSLSNAKRLEKSDMGTLCLILGIFIPIVAAILMQERINAICTAKPVKEQTSAAEERNAAEALRGYKDLLDAGIITQEEFDAKKKQLLGL